MANTDPPDMADTRDQVAELRRALEATLQQSQAEITRLRRQLGERGAADGDDAGRAADLLLQQRELQQLKITLGARDRSVEILTAECQRLGDDLENAQLEIDRLKQELVDRDALFNLSREDSNRLRQDLETLQDSIRSQLAKTASASRGQSTRAPWPYLGAALLFVVVLGLLAWPHLAPRLIPRAPEAPMPWAEPEARETPSAAPAAPVIPVAPPEIKRDRLRDGSLGPAMAVLPGGRFEMGQNALAGEDFGPPREVQVEPFWMSVYEVTFQDYDRFAQETRRRLPADFGWGRGTRPVVDVTWNDARAYAAWLSRATGQRYRLPSEAEWEYAARAGGRGSYWWGFGVEPGQAVCIDCGSRWDSRSTAPVGSFAPSSFGLYDTAGNAMEWVADCYRSNYTDAPRDSRPWLASDCDARAARGGAFNLPAASMRAYVRNRFVPGTRLNMLGFRLARDP